jgi:Zn-dependent peptidase ImmA (M78 family)
MSEAVRRWRQALEAKGILVFLFSMGGDACRGFSLWNARAPVIVLNTSFNPAARVFTLFHELAHLLTRSDSVCVGVPTTRADPAERRCEEFAANMLLPEQALSRALEDYWAKRGKGRVADFETVRWAAGSFKVSLRAMALTLIRRKYAHQDLYAEVDEVAKTDTDKGGGGGGGERRPEKRAREYGETAARLLLRAADEGLLGPHDLVDYFQLPLSEVNEIRGKIA